MNLPNNTYRFFQGGRRVATGKILKDTTILQVFPYIRDDNDKPRYLPPFTTLKFWQRAFESDAGIQIDYIEEEGRDRTWRHERIPDDEPPTITRPPFLEPVSPRVSPRQYMTEDVWELVRSGAPDAPRNADAERKRQLADVIDSLTNAIGVLRMM